jgi:anti-anti-sigma regulatory factor
MNGHRLDAELDSVPTVVDVVEELDLGSLPRLRSLLEEAISARLDVIVDLTECEFIDGACARELLLAQARLGLQKRRLVVISEPTTVVFFVLRLFDRQALTIYPARQLGQIALQLP